MSKVTRILGLGLLSCGLFAGAGQAQFCDPNGVELSCGQTVSGRLSLQDVDCLSSDGLRLNDDFRIDAVAGTTLTVEMSAAPADFTPVLELVSPTSAVTRVSANASPTNTASLPATICHDFLVKNM